MKRQKICFVATVDFTIKVFLVDHFKAMYPKYDINVITNTKDVTFLKPLGLDLKIIPLSIERKISPVHDLVALFRLYSLFRKYKFDVVHSIMPKSGLLSMLAALFAGIPVRIHT
ncbi:MAG: glycosyltransferase family 1 protein, partial [Proteobacteria bacterium]|nr:glycosyltransferase family 1 protein [Pseudomonadota bacterium]